MLEKSNCEKTFFAYIAQFIPEETSNATIKTKLAYARFSESVLTSFRLPEDIQIYQLGPAWQSKRRNKEKKKLSYLYLCYSIRVQEYLCSTKFTFNILANQNKITKYLSKLKREKTRVN